MGSTGDAEGDAGVGEGAGTINNTRITGNTVTVSAVDGNCDCVLRRQHLHRDADQQHHRHNHVFGSSPNGSVVLVGGGLQAGGPLTLQNSTVSGNTGHASGVTGSAQGGGIFAVDESATGGPPGGPLILTNSRIVSNLLSGSPAVTLQGGGIFATRYQPRHADQQPDRRQLPRPVRRLLTKTRKPDGLRTVGGRSDRCLEALAPQGLVTAFRDQADPCP